MENKHPMAAFISKSDNRNGLLQPVLLSDHEFERLGTFIMSQYGIKMPLAKKSFLQSRLQKRLRILGYSGFKEYTDFIFTPKGQLEEISYMIDAVSTNKTDFFREPAHFEFLMTQGLETYIRRTGRNLLTVWSAGCSTGEEPYTIAMVLQEFFAGKGNTSFSILASDISRGVLELAVTGIYQAEKLLTIPTAFRNKYLHKGKGQYENKVRIIPELRSKVLFKQLNLLETGLDNNNLFDIIFCRNVLIYFERELQYRILKQLCQQLRPGGYLFLGHSESIQGLNLPLDHLQPTIFMKEVNGN